MNAADAQRHIEDMKAEISDLLFFLVTVEREIELIQPKIESKIVKPLRTININNLTQKDLEVDVIPINLATMEIVNLRKQWHYAKIERANTLAAIEAKKEMLSSYVEHIKQELSKGSQKIKDDMIFSAFRTAQGLKGLNEEEKAVVTDIKDRLMTIINGDPESKEIAYTKLQLLIKLHS
jgi:hypothetical protein